VAISPGTHPEYFDATTGACSVWVPFLDAKNQAELGLASPGVVKPRVAPVADTVKAVDAKEAKRRAAKKIRGGTIGKRRFT